MQIVVKQYRDLPAAHRQPNHDGHCRLLHGHNWGFDISLACSKKDECGFILDVGKMQPIKHFLEEFFDHTILLNRNDPDLKFLQKQLEGGAGLGPLAKIMVVPDCSMEGLAEFVHEKVNKLIDDGVIPGYDRGVRCVSVTCWEDTKNSAIYTAF